MRKNNLSIHSENILPIIKKWLYSDKDIFLRELVSNASDAIKKLRIILGDEGEFKISIQIDKAAKTITISDNGIGMTQETIAKLFQKFSRADDASKTSTTGTGLGLYVADKLVKAHKGKIWAESEGEGKGSTFFVELPATD